MSKILHKYGIELSIQLTPMELELACFKIGWGRRREGSRLVVSFYLAIRTPLDCVWRLLTCLLWRLVSQRK